MNRPTPSDQALFADHWNVYQRVLDGNYLFHRELSADVERLLHNTRAEPFNWLDLGCGDASPFLPLLAKLHLASYTGVDLSASALDLAARHLAELTGPVSLRQGDMLEFLSATTERYAVIFSSFALHHLNATAKQTWLTACRERLQPTGQLLLIDIARDANQDLPTFLEDYCRKVTTEWNGLNAAERASIAEHVRDNDVPESVSDLAAMAELAGFTRFVPVARYTWHHLFHLQA